MFNSAKNALRRIALILYRACWFRSLESALWLDEYENGKQEGRS